MNSDVPLHPFPFHGGGVTAVVTTRHGGVSTGPYDSLNLGGHVGDDPKAVAENRHRLAAAVGAARVTFADQKHTDRIAIVGEPPAGRGHDGREQQRAGAGELAVRTVHVAPNDRVGRRGSCAAARG